MLIEIILKKVTLWGIASDKIGRKLIYVISFILMGLSILAQPFCPTFISFLMVRIVFGLGAAGSILLEFNLHYN